MLAGTYLLGLWCGEGLIRSGKLHLRNRAIRGDRTMVLGVSYEFQVSNWCSLYE